jgi:hypothetical protein
MKNAKILTAVLFLIAGCANEASESTAGSLRVNWIIQNFICNGPLTIKLGNNQSEIVPCQVAGSHLFNTIDAGEYVLTVEYQANYHGSHQIIIRNINILPSTEQQENFIF